MFKQFHDESNTDYDKVIQAARDRYNDNKEFGLKEVNQLIVDLHEIKAKYWPRPCVEGYCFGLFIPHRSRIENRIKEFNKNRILLDNMCHHKYGVLRVFEDENNNYDYDTLFKQTRETFLSNSIMMANPIEKCSRLEKTIDELKKIRKSYWSRPCTAGNCLGVFTPHKDRIDRRIKALEISLNHLKLDCDSFEKEAIEKEKQQRKNDALFKSRINNFLDIFKNISKGFIELANDKNIQNLLRIYAYDKKNDTK